MPTSTELADDAHPFTTDCAQHAHLELDDAEHARWHVEQAAHLDTDQQSMFG